MGRSTRVRGRPERSARAATSRRRVADALGGAELLAAITRDLILFVDPADGRILDANPAATGAYGYSLAELRSLSIRDLRAPGHQASVAADLARAGVEGIRFDTVHRRKDGTIFPVEVSSSNATIDGVRTLISIVRDMTAHDEAERRVRASEERLRLLIEHAPAAVAMFDREMRYLAVSRRYLADYRLEPRDLLGRSHYEVFPEVPDRWREIHRRCLAGAIESCEEDPFPRADGTTDWVKWEICPWRDARGEIGGVILFSELATPRRRYEEQLAAERERLASSERRYRLLADHAHDVIWTLDLASGRFGYMSPSIQSLRGLTVEEALEEPLERSLTPESFARAQALLARVGTSEADEPRTDVYDQPCKDGTVKHVEITTTLVRDASGRPVEVVGVSRDATARVDAQRRLEESEGLYRSLFQLAPNGVVLVDEHGAFEAFNDQAWRQLGYTREEFARLRVSDIDVEEREPALIEAHLARVAALGLDEFEARHRTKAGEIRNVLVSSRPVVVGGRRRFLALWHDVTDRRRAEEAERRTEARFRALIEKSADLIAVVGADGRRKFWSQGGVEALGWTPEELVGQPALDIVHPEDRPRAAEALQQLRGGPGSAPVIQIRLLHKDGSWRWVEATARNLLADPAVEGIVVNGRDVTGQRLLEEQLRQAQKLESVGRLAGGVAHDFNNLLTVILSCATSLEETLSRGEPASPEDAQEIGAAARRAAELTGQLLAFARKQAVHRIAIDLGAVVKGSEGMLRRLLGEDVDLRIECPPDLWTTSADPGQLTQVVVNLAVNARDAMPSGGTLLMELSNVVVPGPAGDAGRAPGEWVQLRIRDSGTGMSDEVKAHLFEPFFTTKGPGRGTGLGLATVYGIVQQAGGHVSVQSEPGRGTAFELRFPRVGGDPAARPAPPGGVAALGGNERILVVEDDPQVRSVTVRTLRTAGYDVVAVAHAQQALELPEEEGRRLDLVVTDVVMPGLDGRVLARELRRRYARVRVLYLSGYTPDLIAERGGGDEGEPLGALLAKPFTAAELLAEVRSTLDAR